MAPAAAIWVKLEAVVKVTFAIWIVDGQIIQENLVHFSNMINVFFLPTQFVVLFSTNKKISVLDQVDITMILMAHYSLFLAFNYGDRIFFSNLYWGQQIQCS